MLVLGSDLLPVDGSESESESVRTESANCERIAYRSFRADEYSTRSVKMVVGRLPEVGVTGTKKNFTETVRQKKKNTSCQVGVFPTIREKLFFIKKSPSSQK